MKRAVLIAGFVLAIAATDGWAANSSPPTRVSGQAKAPKSAKLAELETILLSRNDNDPRLDLDFNGLSTEDKRLFRKKYRDIAAEKRNERGTIVYLLGRNLKTREDWEFFRQVALEPPCLSLSDCSKKPAHGSDEEATGDEVTLAYPSLVALRQAGNAAEKARAAVSAKGASKSSAEQAALDLFAAAKESKTRAVTRLAASLEKKFALP
jgi:hypothetical protein